MRETLADGTFESIVAAAERVIPVVPTNAPTWLVPSPERRLRMVRIALDAGRQDEALRMFALSDQVSLSGLSAAHIMPLTQVLTSSTDPASAGLRRRIRPAFSGTPTRHRHSCMPSVSKASYLSSASGPPVWCR